MLRLSSTFRIDLFPLVDVLLKPLVVHIQVSHWFFFRSGRCPLESIDKLLIINFEFVFDFLLFVLKLIDTIASQMFALDFRSVESKPSQALLVLLV